MPVYPSGAYFFGTYYVEQIINGLPQTQIKCCPIDGDIYLAYPAYLNNTNASGLSQPWGPIGDNGLIHSSGITAPSGYYLDASGNATAYARPATSGLTRGPYEWPAFGGGGMNWQEPNMAGVYGSGLQQGTTGTGFDGHTDFMETNWYQPYWLCSSGHYFLYPSASGLPLPNGALQGNNEPFMTNVDASVQIEQP